MMHNRITNLGYVDKEMKWFNYLSECIKLAPKKYKAREEKVRIVQEIKIIKY